MGVADGSVQMGMVPLTIRIPEEKKKALITPIAPCVSRDPRLIITLQAPRSFGNLSSLSARAKNTLDQHNEYAFTREGTYDSQCKNLQNSVRQQVRHKENWLEPQSARVRLCTVTAGLTWAILSDTSFISTTMRFVSATTLPTLTNLLRLSSAIISRTILPSSYSNAHIVESYCKVHHIRGNIYVPQNDPMIA